MDLALTPDLEQLIDEQLTRGRLRTPKEVVREALLLLCPQSPPDRFDSGQRIGQSPGVRLASAQ
ncbi:MAG: hypothetical protein GY842_06735 [bacterium]|nr:hypothetical protein [bacterium]